MTISPVSPTNRKPRVNLGSLTALAQSAWMGFPLAADVLEQFFLAPIALLRRGTAILPKPPKHIHTPLLTNTVQLGLRIVLISLLIGRLGAVAIPVAFVVSCSLETVALISVLVLRLRRRGQESSTRREPLGV